MLCILSNRNKVWLVLKQGRRVHLAVEQLCFIEDSDGLCGHGGRGEAGIPSSARQLGRLHQLWQLEMTSSSDLIS